MKSLRQVLFGVIIALVSIFLVLGGFSLSLAEANISSSRQTITPTQLTTTRPFTLSPGSPTISSTLTFTVSITLTPTRSSTMTSTWTPVPSASASICPKPVDWVYYSVQAGETWDKIAADHRTTSVQLQQANCLSTPTLLPGMLIYVPPLTTQTRIPCGRPNGWVPYLVRTGDNLYQLSLAYGVSVAQLQQANCLSNANIITAGQILFVPPWAPRTPIPTLPIPSLPASTSETLVPPTNTPEIPVLPTETAETPVPPTDTPEPPVLPTDTATEIPVTP